MKYFIIFHFHSTNSIQQNPSNNNFPIISHSLSHCKHSVPTMRAALHSLDERGGWWSPEEAGRGDGAASEHRLLPSLPPLVPPAQGTPTNVFVKNKPLYAVRKSKPKNKTRPPQRHRCTPVRNSPPTPLPPKRSREISPAPIDSPAHFVL